MSARACRTSVENVRSLPSVSASSPQCPTRSIIPGLPSPDNASAAMRTSGSSIDTTLVDRGALSSPLMVIPGSDGLSTADSKLLLVLVARNGAASVRGRLLTDAGEPCVANAGCMGEARWYSGERMVFKSGSVMSACE